MFKHELYMKTILFCDLGFVTEIALFFSSADTIVQKGVPNSFI
jgi:hypothetical protein